MADRKTKGGYESGDTPASELLERFPDVLFQPGAGVAPKTVTQRSTDEPKDAAPKVPLLPCPKCGEPDTAMRWCAGGYSIGYGHCVTTVKDHFHRECPNCRYGWKTFDTLDGAA